MKAIEDQLRGEFTSLNKSDLHALCRRSEHQPVTLTDWIKGKKTLSIKLYEDFMKEKYPNCDIEIVFIIHEKQRTNER